MIGSVTIRELTLVVMVTGILLAVIVPNCLRSNRAVDGVTVCTSNLHQLGTALELYQTDQGEYPAGLGELCPKYLRGLPECTGRYRSNTYKLTLGATAPYNDEGRQQYFLLECMGHEHEQQNLPPDYPKYNSLVGAILPERSQE